MRGAAAGDAVHQAGPARQHLRRQPGRGQGRAGRAESAGARWPPQHTCITIKPTCNSAHLLCTTSFTCARTWLPYCACISSLYTVQKCKWSWHCTWPCALLPHANNQMTLVGGSDSMCVDSVVHLEWGWTCLTGGRGPGGERGAAGAAAAQPAAGHPLATHPAGALPPEGRPRHGFPDVPFSAWPRIAWVKPTGVRVDRLFSWRPVQLRTSISAAFSDAREFDPDSM